MRWLRRSLLAIAALLLAGFAYEWIAETRDAAAYPPPGQLIAVDGHRLHIHCIGTEGPTVVVEQGVGGPSILWQPVAREIAKFARLCLYDRPGYQWSEPVPGPRSIEARAAELHKLLQTAGISGPYIFVAHSYGGLIVRLIARDHPSDVAGMVLVDTPDEGVAFTDEYQRLTQQGETMVGLIAIAAHFGIVRIWSAITSDGAVRGLSPEMNGALTAATVRPSFFAAIADDLASISNVPPAMRTPGAFGRLGGKPLIFVKHGIPFPEPFAFIEKYWDAGAERQLALSTNSALIVAHKANHMIANDQPEAVIEAIRRVVTAARNGSHIESK